MTKIFTPKYLEEALELLAEKHPPQPLAGGTDLLVIRKDEPERFSSLMVLEKLQELSGIHKDNGRIRIGSFTTHADIEHSPVLKEYASVLSSAASEIGSVQIRNRGTIGGNIINASPAGDLIPPLIALDAVFELHSSKAKREVPAREFFLGPGKSVREPKELLIAIHFTVPEARERGVFLKLGPRKAQAISKVMLAAQGLVHHEAIEWIRIAIGAVAPTVIRAPQTEALLQGTKLSPELIEEAKETVRREVSPITDIRSTEEYRHEVAGVLLQRALESILK